jgi:hypothetical protein
MGKSRSPNPTASAAAARGKSFTPPKGRPTRSRRGYYGRKQVFGPTAQWIALTIFLILVFVVLFILTDGGDFNPFNGDQSNAALVRGAASQVVAAWSAPLNGLA